MKKIFLCILFAFVSILIFSCSKNNITPINNSVTLSSVTICNQIWTSENLDVSNYSNGDLIPQITDQTLWANTTQGAWCWYGNDSSTYSEYGKLYNRYAVSDPRGLAPTGWHIPSKSEWNKLIKCVDPTADTTINGIQSGIAGGALKEAGTTHWNSPNAGATNSSGFNGLPGGFRLTSGNFGNIGQYGGFWSSSGPVNRILSYNYSSMYGYQYYTNNSNMGLSIRLVKN